MGAGSPALVIGDRPQFCFESIETVVCPLLFLKKDAINGGQAAVLLCTKKPCSVPYCFSLFPSGLERGDECLPLESEYTPMVAMVPAMTAARIAFSSTWGPAVSPGLETTKK